jgi:hypothetical protein
VSEELKGIEVTFGKEHTKTWYFTPEEHERFQQDFIDGKPVGAYQVYTDAEKESEALTVYIRLDNILFMRPRQKAAGISTRRYTSTSFQTLS